MAQQYLFVIGILLVIESAVLYLAGHPRTQKYFNFLPAVFWIYFLPMLFSTAGILDAQSPVYGMITTHLLPASLFLLLIPVDIRSILQLGKPALIMMASGSVGMIIGTVVSFSIFQNIVGKEFWSGFGALSGSWTGGSANMIAVKEAIGTPDRVFLPMVIVDTIVPYLWMGILVAIVKLQPKIDTWLRADKNILAALRARAKDPNAVAKKTLKFLPTLGLILLAVAGSALAQFFAGLCPEVKNIFSTYAWTIIIVSFLGIAFSFTPARKIEAHGASRVGYFLLYFVLTSIGAKASIANLGSAAVLILAGLVIVLIHATILIATARLIRAPMFLAAVASQANIGGVASTPVVAEIYQPGFASVGLLLAILGNIVGTYLGILTAQLCRWISF